MGSRDDNPLASNDEKPQHTVDISYDYWMARFPITNEQYNLYVQAQKGKHPITGWQEQKEYPVVNVSWKDAQAYCKWLNRTQGKELLKNLVFRLPTEAEWEKAASGEFGFEWPWGNEFDPNKCHTTEGGAKGWITPVNAYSPAGDSPYGAADMVGNVWEWTHSLYKPYPYRVDDGREDEKNALSARVLRGGVWGGNRFNARCSYRFAPSPKNLPYFIGFRVVCVPSFKF